MTYKFKIGDLVRILKRDARGPYARGVITGRGYNGAPSESLRAEPYYEIQYLDPRAKSDPWRAAPWWAEELLQLIEDPNSIMKEIV